MNLKKKDFTLIATAQYLTVHDNGEPNINTKKDEIMERAIIAAISQAAVPNTFNQGMPGIRKIFTLIPQGNQELIMIVLERKTAFDQKLYVQDGGADQNFFFKIKESIEKQYVTLLETEEKKQRATSY